MAWISVDLTPLMNLRARTTLFATAAAMALIMAACATTNDPSRQLTGAVVTERMAENGDLVTEYRVAGQLRLIKVTPSGGAPYYIRDENNDGVLDKRDGVARVYWRLFGW